MWTHFTEQAHGAVKVTWDGHVVTIDAADNVSDLHPVALSDMSVPLHLRGNSILPGWDGKGRGMHSARTRTHTHTHTHTHNLKGRILMWMTQVYSVYGVHVHVMNTQTRHNFLSSFWPDYRVHVYFRRARLTYQCSRSSFLTVAANLELMDHLFSVRRVNKPEDLIKNENQFVNVAPMLNFDKAVKEHVDAVKSLWKSTSSYGNRRHQSTGSQFFRGGRSHQGCGGSRFGNQSYPYQSNKGRGRFHPYQRRGDFQQSQRRGPKAKSLKAKLAVPETVQVPLVYPCTMPVVSALLQKQKKNCPHSVSQLKSMGIRQIATEMALATCRPPPQIYIYYINLQLWWENSFLLCGWSTKSIVYPDTVFKTHGSLDVACQFSLKCTSRPAKGRPFEVMHVV